MNTTIVSAAVALALMGAGVPAASAEPSSVDAIRQPIVRQTFAPWETLTIAPSCPSTHPWIQKDGIKVGGVWPENVTYLVAYATRSQMLLTITNWNFHEVKLSLDLICER